MPKSSLVQIAAALANVRRALIVSHIMPDGDTIGSALGLAWALKSRGIECRLSCADPVPSELAFLPGSADFCARRLTDEDIIFVVDSGDVSRMGPIYDTDAFARVPVVNIDHHVTNSKFGDIQCVETRAATAELILELLEHLEIEIDVTIATCLLCGIVTDTRAFRTSNTSPIVLAAAVKLMEAGAPLTEITDAVFDHRSLGLLRLWGQALAKTRIDNGILWAELPHVVFGQTGSTLADSKGLVNFLISIHDAHVALVLRETGDGQIDISLRAKPGIDVSGVATSFGGGGHPQAAGCLVPGQIEDVRSRIVEALHKALAVQS